MALNAKVEDGADSWRHQMLSCMAGYNTCTVWFSKTHQNVGLTPSECRGSPRNAGQRLAFIHSSSPFRCEHTCISSFRYYSRYDITGHIFIPVSSSVTIQLCMLHNYSPKCISINVQFHLNPHPPCQIFTHLKLWIASARHNFKWVKIQTPFLCTLYNHPSRNESHPAQYQCWKSAGDIDPTLNQCWVRVTSNLCIFV